LPKAKDYLSVYACDEMLWDKNLCFAGIDEAGLGAFGGLRHGGLRGNAQNTQDRGGV